MRSIDLNCVVDLLCCELIDEKSSAKSLRYSLFYSSSSSACFWSSTYLRCYKLAMSEETNFDAGSFSPSVSFFCPRLLCSTCISLPVHKV